MQRSNLVQGGRQNRLIVLYCIMHSYATMYSFSLPQPIAADSTCMSGDGHVTSSAVLEFLSGLSGLSVSRGHGSDTTAFYCKVTDGALTGEQLPSSLECIASDYFSLPPSLPPLSLPPKGHVFSLTLDSLCSEFTYQPLQKSPSLPADSVLADTTCFPDYMQSRFLLNLLNTTFVQPDS